MHGLIPAVIETDLSLCVLRGSLREHLRMRTVASGLPHPDVRGKHQD